MEHPTLPTQVCCSDGRYVTTGVPPRKPEEMRRLLDWIVELGLEPEFPEAVFLRLGAEKESIDLKSYENGDTKARFRYEVRGFSLYFNFAF